MPATYGGVSRRREWDFSGAAVFGVEYIPTPDPAGGCFLAGHRQTVPLERARSADRRGLGLPTMPLGKRLARNV